MSDRTRKRTLSRRVFLQKVGVASAGLFLLEGGRPGTPKAAESTKPKESSTRFPSAAARRRRSIPAPPNTATTTTGFLPTENGWRSAIRPRRIR